MHMDTFGHTLIFYTNVLPNGPWKNASDFWGPSANSIDVAGEGFDRD